MGHFNALFGIARALQQTHTVVFAGTGFFAQHVRNAGFNFHILYTFPFGLGLESWIHEIRKSKHPRLANIKDRWRDTLYHERRKELSRILEEYQPQHVLVDVQQATDLVVLKSIDPNLRVTGISVAPPYYLIPGVPPANSTALPGETEQIEQWHNKVRNDIRAKQWRQRLRYLGMDDQWMIRRRLRRNGVLHLKAKYDSLFTLAIDGVEQLVLTYREFDFASEHLPHLRYVGAHPDTTVPESGTEVTGKLVNDIQAQGRLVVYCSFGTVPPARNILMFLEHLSKALAPVNGHAIVSARPNTIDKNRLQAEGNLSIFEWVPQAFILKSAKVFVTHGGINSVHHTRMGTASLYPEKREGVCDSWRDQLRSRWYPERGTDAGVPGRAELRSEWQCGTSGILWTGTTGRAGARFGFGYPAETISVAQRQSLSTSPRRIQTEDVHV